MSQLECDFWVTGRQHPIATADQHLTEQHGHRAGHTARAAVQSKGERTEALAKWRKPKPKSRILIPGKKEPAHTERGRRRKGGGEGEDEEGASPSRAYRHPSGLAHAVPRIDPSHDRVSGIPACPRPTPPSHRRTFRTRAWGGRQNRREARAHTTSKTPKNTNVQEGGIRAPDAGGHFHQQSSRSTRSPQLRNYNL